MSMRVLTIAIAFTLLSGASAHAWGGQGHRLIAALTYERLTPTARATVDRLIAIGPAQPVEGCVMTSFEDASTWPDCARSKEPHKRTYNEHFDDIPIFGVEPKRTYCAENLCATEAIKRNRHVLADRRASDGDRAQALAFLVHYIGDLHQPLHSADNKDKGGNDVKVVYLGQATFIAPWNGQPTQNNLHGTWDTSLVAAAFGADGSGRSIVSSLADANARRWRGFSPDRWARESHRIAVRSTYGLLPLRMTPNIPPSEPIEIDQEYVDATTPIVREQLAKAVVRTASTLNDTLR